MGDDVKSYKIEPREWQKGDMVKVNAFDITGLPTYSYGIIVGAGKDEQQRIFPYYDVYMLGAGVMETVEAYNLEIISPA